MQYIVRQGAFAIKEDKADKGLSFNDDFDAEYRDDEEDMEF